LQCVFFASTDSVLNLSGRLSHSSWILPDCDCV